MKYIVCFSGGHSSAIAAIETVRRYGKENVTLLNHDISSRVEHWDIKRFKNEIAEYLGLEITYANCENFEQMTPLQSCMNLKAFKIGTGTALCTYNLKTKPFYKWLNDNYPSKAYEPREDVVLIYGFDKNETQRINRRVGVMLAKGYKTDYPLACWDRTIYSTEEIDIQIPLTYNTFRHANCVGCLKAGKQQWFIVYCTRPDIWQQAKQAEELIGHHILKDVYLKDLECKFDYMISMNIEPTETTTPQKFWAVANKYFKTENNLPCECAI